MIKNQAQDFNTNVMRCPNNAKDYWSFWKSLQRQAVSESTIELHQFYDCFLNQSEPAMGESTSTTIKIKQKQDIPIHRYKYAISNDILNCQIQMDEVEK